MEPPLYRLDWLTFAGQGVTDSLGVQWILMEEQGFWDAPDVRSDLVERVNAHGAYVGPAYKQERVITLRGRFYSHDPRQMRAAWARITGMGADPTEFLSLSCDTEIGTMASDVRLDGKVETKPLQLLNVHGVEFSMNLVAPDPRKYSDQWHTMRAELPQANVGDGLDFAVATGGGFGPTYRGLVHPLTFGTSNSTGFLQLTNGGTAPTCPVYTLTGPLTTPTLTATTGTTTAQMRYNGSLDAGQSIVINPAVPSVLLGGTASRRHLLNPANFQGFFIPAADNATGTEGVLNVGLTHAGAVTTGGYATARFRDAWF